MCTCAIPGTAAGQLEHGSACGTRYIIRSEWPARQVQATEEKGISRIRDAQEAREHTPAIHPLSFLSDKELMKQRFVRLGETELEVECRKKSRDQAHCILGSP